MASFQDKSLKEVEDALRDTGFNPKALKDMGMTAGQLKATCFDCAELKEAGFNTVELRCAGFGVSELREGEFSAAEVSSAGFSHTRLRKGGFEAEELKEMGVSLMELARCGYTAAQLKACTFQCSELKSVGFTVADLRNLFTPGELHRAGYVKEDLKPHGLWPHDGDWQGYNKYWNCCFDLDKKSIYCTAHGVNSTDGNTGSSTGQDAKVGGASSLLSSISKHF